MKNNLDELMSKIEYKFKNIKLLYESLTHRSYLNEHTSPSIKDNERLEFLGDAVMDLITTEYIYKKNFGSNEGELSKNKSKIISEKVWASIGRDIELGKYIFLSNGEEMNDGRNRDSILADAFEALVGAVFLDSDFETAKKIFLNLLEYKINNLDKIEGIVDYKTTLQEITQMKYKTIPVYKTISEIGPDHSKIFEIEVSILSKKYATAQAKSKKEAEKKAAKIAIEMLKME